MGALCYWPCIRRASRKQLAEVQKVEPHAQKNRDGQCKLTSKLLDDVCSFQPLILRHVASLSSVLPAVESIAMLSQPLSLRRGTSEEANGPFRIRDARRLESRSRAGVCSRRAPRPEVCPWAARKIRKSYPQPCVTEREAW